MDTASPRDDAREALLGRLVAWFEEAEAASRTARAAAQRDRDYYDGRQWTDAELEALQKRRQPALTINYVRRKIELLRGLERRARTDPKAIPRTPTEDARADAATQALRYVADDSDFDAVRSAVYDNMLVEGFGAAEVLVVATPGDDGPDVRINHVPWERVFHDPHSSAGDFSDARYLGVVVWMDRDEAVELYPEAAGAMATMLASGLAPGVDGFEDRPRDLAWVDTRRTRVRVAQIYWRQGGQWWMATYTRGGFLDGPYPSPYLDRRGASACPLILRSAYIDRENNRYGTVRDLIGLQDEINKRRSKALHLLSVRQVVAEQGAVADVDLARRELAKPDGFIEVNRGFQFQIQPNGDLTSGQFNLLQHATTEMQASGPNASLAGKDPRELSGRAIQAQQAGGQMELEPVMDGLRAWTRDVYEAAWMRVRQFWQGERWVRVTDDRRNLRWVGLNRQVTLRDALAELPPERRLAAEHELVLQPGDARLDQVVRVDNPIGDLDVDIVVDTGPDVPSLQAEQFQQLAQMASSGVAIPADVLIAASSLRNKDELLRRLEQAPPAARPGA